MIDIFIVACMLAGIHRSTMYTDMFRMPPTTDNYVAAVSLSADSAKTMTIDMIEFPGDGTKRLRMSARVLTGVRQIRRVNVYSYDRPNYTDKQGRFVKVFAEPFLITNILSAKGSRTLVWTFDWHTLRPKLEFDAPRKRLPEIKQRIQKSKK